MTGAIYGCEMSRKEEDNVKLTIDNVFKKFEPMVEPESYRLTFTPVESRGLNLRIIEIRVNRGDPCEMFEDMFHEVRL